MLKTIKMGPRRATWITGAAIVASLLPTLAQASDTALLETLLKNGVISKTQFEKLTKKGGSGEMGSNDLLEILTQNGAITQDQAKALSKKKEPVKLVNSTPGQGQDDLDNRLKSVESKVKKAEDEKKAKAELPQRDKKWYDRYTIGGYTQLRFSALTSGDEKNVLSLPNDKSIGAPNNLFLRRARLKLSGDVTDWLSIYTQLDFASSISGVSASNSTSTNNFAQIRDLYGDIYFDDHKEFRLRPGISKVPFGWELLQSSQNRTSQERAQVTSPMTIRDERDLGAFFYWSPKEAQDRFKYLVKSGLKGSGDYGVFGFGFFNGQGLDRFELNQSMHSAVRLTYPFEIPGDQMLEVGASGFTGRYINTPTALTYTPEGSSRTITTTPVVTCQNKLSTGGVRFGNNGGCNDERVGMHAILYPKPIGIQAEWIWGYTPMLNDESVRVGKPYVEGGSLNGGYVQVQYMLEHFYGTWYPYFKYEQYDGGSKFDANSPHARISHYEWGVEYDPLPEFALRATYDVLGATNVTQTTSLGRFEGLNNGLPYGFYNGNIVRLGLQWNY
jgi:hypothetical protein